MSLSSALQMPFKMGAALRGRHLGLVCSNAQRLDPAGHGSITTTQPVSTPNRSRRPTPVTSSRSARRSLAGANFRAVWLP